MRLPRVGDRVVFDGLDCVMYARVAAVGPYSVWIDNGGAGHELPISLLIGEWLGHNTYGNACWCHPRIERHEHADIVIHNEDT